MIREILAAMCLFYGQLAIFPALIRYFSFISRSRNTASGRSSAEIEADDDAAVEGAAGRRRGVSGAHHRVNRAVERRGAGRTDNGMADDSPGAADGERDADRAGFAARPRRGGIAFVAVEFGGNDRAIVRPRRPRWRAVGDAGAMRLRAAALRARATHGVAPGLRRAPALFPQAFLPSPPPAPVPPPHDGLPAPPVVFARSTGVASPVQPAPPVWPRDRAPFRRSRRPPASRAPAARALAPPVVALAPPHCLRRSRPCPPRSRPVESHRCSAARARPAASGPARTRSGRPDAPPARRPSATGASGSAAVPRRLTAALPARSVCSNRRPSPPAQ